MSYIEIVRYFSEQNADLDAPPSWMRRSSEKGTTWSTLLRPVATDSIVLVAPSGSGKSTELEREARRRQQHGEFSIFADASAIADDGLRDAMSTQDRDTFDRWLATATPLILFVDAVDELALRNKGLKDLLRRLESAIDFGIRDVQLVLTARQGWWQQPNTDRLLVTLSRGRSEFPKVRIVTFERLDDPAVRALATGNGVTDVDRFMAAFAKDELNSLLYDVRPQDVKLLAQRWKRAGRFGRWSQLLDDFVTLALEADRKSTFLTVEDGHVGLRRVGAALVLGKRNFISLPIAAPSTIAMTSRRLFDDWRLDKMIDLFETPLFVQKGREGQVVQLAEGALAPFLAAQWLAERVRSGVSFEGLLELIMVRVFGESELHLPRSRVALAGWLAGDVSDLRAYLRDHHPDVLLNHGDPDRLPDQDIDVALFSLWRKVVEGEHLETPSNGTIRKLARSSLEPLVLSLLSTRPTSMHAQYHLLRFVELGNYRSCVPIALSIAHDPNAQRVLRRVAISAVISAGDNGERQKLTSLVSEPSPQIRTELLPLLPAVIKDDDLLTLVGAGGDLEFRYQLRRAAQRIPTAELDTLLSRALPALTSDVHDAATEQAFSVAISLVAERVRRGLAPDVVLRVIHALDSLGPGFFVPSEDEEDLAAAFRADASARHRLWLLRADDSPLSARMLRVGALVSDDMPWLIELWQRASESPSSPNKRRVSAARTPS